MRKKWCRGVILVLISWLLVLLCFYIAFRLRSINQKWPFFVLLGSAALALCNSAFALSLEKGIALILLGGLPIMAVLSFFTAPAVGYRMQNFVFARNVVLAVLGLATLSFFAAKRIEAMKDDARKIFVAIQSVGIIILLLLYGSKLANV